jgi:hypothetical protein
MQKHGLKIGVGVVSLIILIVVIVMLTGKKEEDEKPDLSPLPIRGGRGGRVLTEHRPI